MNSDDGLTLVELIVTIFISALFLGLLAVMFGNGLSSQEQATARDRATGQANVIGASLTASVRNATSVRVTSDGSRLDAAVLTPSNTWECRSWAIDDERLVYSAGNTPRPATTSGWLVLASQVETTLMGGKAFGADGDRGVTIGLRVVDSNQTTTMTNGVTAQAVASGGALACW